MNYKEFDPALGLATFLREMSKLYGARFTRSDEPDWGAVRFACQIRTNEGTEEEKRHTAMKMVLYKDLDQWWAKSLELQTFSELLELAYLRSLKAD